MAGLSAKALRQLNNIRTTQYFGIAIGVLIGLFTLLHWSRLIFRRYGSREKGRLRSCVVAGSRAMRSITYRKVPGFASVGHLSLFTIYIIINIILTFVNMDWSALHNFAKRLGWIATCNLVLTIFLSLKNTPLMVLTPYSHNHLNSLHRAAGYVLVTYGTLHAIVYIKAWADEGVLNELSEWSNVAGIVAGISFLIIAATSTFLRNRHYELFYIIHVILFLLVMIMMGYHRPVVAKKTAILIMIGSGFWFLDRLIRGLKMLCSIGNYATITPLENGKGSRIVLNKGIWGAKPGLHAFLWIPGIRKFETHPFTISRVDSGSVEFVLKSYDGFTRDLSDFAAKNPGARLRAGLDGPYGSLPVFEDADKVILIAGGTGASFSAGLATRVPKIPIEFIWVVRNEAQISWYAKELEDLQAAPNVTIKLFCTNSSTSVSHNEKRGESVSITSASSGTEREPEEKITTTTKCEEPIPSPTKLANSSNIDVEKQIPATGVSRVDNLPHSLAGINIASGRPDLGALISESVKQAGGGERVLICACGPDGMMLEIRKTVAGIIGEDLSGSASVEMHLEAFGW